MDADGAGFVSTGELPIPERVQRLVEEAYDRFDSVDDGVPSGVYPALGRVDPSLFGICIVEVNGEVHVAGDADVSFPIMSVAKPITFALVCDAVGPEVARHRIGVDATGLPFNSVEAVERGGGRTNPMVNPGAIAAVGLLMRHASDPWDALLRGLSRFAGEDLELDEETYRSASETNQRNRALVNLLDSMEMLDGDPSAVLDLYTRQSCVSVNALQLATMGATLADGGVNPLTRERVVTASACRSTLAVMATAGLYESSGDWLYRVGLPGKSGIGGGIVTVSPGKGGLATFAPPLDSAGNSVRGQLVAEFLADRLGLDVFASEAAPPTR